MPEKYESVSMACFKNAKAENINLRANMEDKEIELSFALQEKKKLLQEIRVRDCLLESRDFLEQSKRLRIENSGASNHQANALLKSQQRIESL